MALLRLLVFAFIAAAGIFVISTAWVALQEAFDQSNFPEALAVKAEVMPVIFPLHMITGGLSLLLVPATYLTRFTRFHRWLGRVAAADVLVAGLTAIPVAAFQPVTFYSGAGFIAQACVWMALLAAGIWHIRRGNIRAHQSAMLMMAAVTSGAVFFRIYLAFWAMYGSRHSYRLFYSCDSWVAWMLPLAVTFALLQMKKGRAKRPSHSTVVA